MVDVCIEKPFKDEELETKGKKDLLKFLQENSSIKFTREHKLGGSLANVAKVKTKDQCLSIYKLLFETKDFKGTAGDIVEARPERKEKPKEKAAEPVKPKKQAPKDEPPKFTKKVMKLGDKTSFPQKGDMVECFYSGKLENGKVFDTNIDDAKKGKAANPLKFKVGTGKVIRGWDEALLTMTKGEKAEITIQPEWAYGKKGLEGKIPANSVLIFEVDLVSVSC